MKLAQVLFLAVFAFLATSFTVDITNDYTYVSTTIEKKSAPSSEKWYMCSYCCKTKKASSAPWEQGCKVSSSGTHNFQFAGNAGTVKHICRNCDAEIYLKQGAGPSASKCCSTGRTHNWSYK